VSSEKRGLASADKETRQRGFLGIYDTSNKLIFTIIIIEDWDDNNEGGCKVKNG
jgi:hypothetical protein